MIAFIFILLASFAAAHAIFLQWQGLCLNHMDWAFEVISLCLPCRSPLEINCKLSSRLTRLPFEIYAENEKSRFNDFRKVYLHKKRLNPDLLISESGQPGFLHNLLRHH